MKYRIQDICRRVLAAVWTAAAVMMWFCATPGAHALEFGPTSHLGQRQGLLSNYITDIAQDSRGILWLATDAGISRFDGYSFTHIPNDTPGMAGSSITSLHYDNNTDQLWIGTKSGLCRLDCHTMKCETIKLDNGAETYNIASLAPASDGGIWIINHYHTITHLRPDGTTDVLSVSNVPGLPESFTCAAEDGHGHLFVGHTFNGISVVDLNEKKAVNYPNRPDDPFSLPSGKVYSLLVDLHRNVWVATINGLSLFIPERRTFVNYMHSPSDPSSIASNRIFSLSEMSDGRIWAGCDQGFVSIFSPSDIIGSPDMRLSFSNHNVKQDPRGISNGNIHSIFEDSSGNVWLGNYGTGLEFISHLKPAFHEIPYFPSPTEGIDNVVIWSAFTDRDGTLMLGATNSIGIFRGRKLTEVVNFPRGLTHTYARASAIGRSGDDILIGLYDDGLLRMDSRTHSISRVESIGNETGINVFFDDPMLGTLIGTSTGISSYKDGIARPLDRLNRHFSYLSVSGILRDGEGNLWISTYGNGVFYFDRTLSKAYHVPVSYTGGGFTKTIFLDSRDNVWVVNKESVARFNFRDDRLVITHYPATNGRKVNNYRGIAEDDLGKIWLSADTGLKILDPRSGTLNTWRPNGGISIFDFNERVLHKMADGSIIAGGMQGAYSIDPESLVESESLGKVELLDCVAIGPDGSEQGRITNDKDGKSIKLSHDHSSVKFVFAVSDLATAGYAEYSVKMDGVDSDWSTPISENTVTYKNLPPGNYRFRVVARRPNGVWDETRMASVGVDVDSPLWQSWWAMTFYVVAIAVIVFFWLKAYKRRVNYRSNMEIERKKGEDVKELNEERLRFYTNITHELRTPLTLILGPLEDLITDENLPGPYKGKIEVIHNSAIRLLNLINQILEFRKTETQNRQLSVSRRNLSDYVMEIGLRYKELNRNRNVDIVIDVEKNVVVYFDPEVMMTVLNNLLSNAMKYTPSGLITISLKRRMVAGLDYTEISVADTGYGIAADALPHIFERYYQAKGKHQASGTGIGLALVKSLSELHGGELDVKSTPGAGTTFTFRILSGNTYPDALHSDAQNEEEDSLEEISGETDSRRKILVVEDAPDIREYIAESLSSEYAVIEAADGKEGLEAAISQNPDIIVSDLMMPVMDGLEMLRKLKGDVRTSHIPVVMLTARDSIIDKEKGYDSGADSYLTKPFSAKLLKSRIVNLLQSRSRLVASIASGPGGSVSPATAGAEPGETEDISRKLTVYDRKFLEKFTALVEKNLANPDLDLNYVMRELGLSHSTIYRKIKGLTGMSGKEYIRKARLKRSAELLMEGMNVSEASLKCGFNDISYFRICFKEEFGLSPTQYVKSRFRTDTAKSVTG